MLYYGGNMGKKTKFDASPNNENIDYAPIREKFTEALIAGNVEEAIYFAQQLPINPGLALAIKRTDGIEALERFNLEEAQKAYPDEFKLPGSSSTADEVATDKKICSKFAPLRKRKNENSRDA